MFRVLYFFLPISSLVAGSYDVEHARTTALERRLAGLGFAELMNHATSDAKGCDAACGMLKSLLRNNAYQPGSKGYDRESADYWSNLQAEQTPNCYVTPDTAKDVAASVLVAEHTNCTFAVKSGGHAAFAGASNINHGFTIDLRNLQEVTVSDDKKTTRVGPGNHWVDVYKALAPKNLTVIGGRVSAIGVGGLTLGGGISFFSGRHGWACDNARNYQVVLGGGRILEVNESSHPDLYFALRGGGNNFGVVTRFDLATFPQGKMLGGTTNYDGAHNASLIKALARFAHDAPSDPDAAVFLAFASANGTVFGNTALEHATPVPRPPIFADFFAVPNLTSTLRITTLPNLTLELNEFNPTGLREASTAATFAVDAALMQDILAIFAEETAGLAHLAAYLPSLVFQAIPKNLARHFGKRGGNALGIDPADAPLLIVSVVAMWARAADDARVLAAATAIRRRAVHLATRRGLANRYIYQNYASLDQDVFRGYGSKNRRRLVHVSRKYDPKRVFQLLQPGYFKLTPGNGGSPAR